MLIPELNDMYARERQRDYLQEAAGATLMSQASAPHPRLSARLAARLGQWSLRLWRRPALRPSVHPAPQQR